MITSQAPGWFINAISTAYEDRWITVAGCPIHYQLWNAQDQRKPGLLFVHGHGAHAHWWDFIAPQLMSDYTVAALDVSGAGDSGHRQTYSSNLFVDELIAVFNHAGFGSNGVIVGHSFGGRMTRLAGYFYPEMMSGVILLDSAIPLPGQNSSFRIPMATTKPTRYYSSRQEAAKRFRLRPPQPCANDFIVTHIANHSVKQTSEGWCWKLDPQVFSKMVDLDSSGKDAGSTIQDMRCKVGIIYGAESRFFNRQVCNYLGSLLPAENLRAVPAAHHHLFLDQPLVFLDTLREMLNRWQT